MKSISVPVCECDHRGIKINKRKGNWCYLKQSPCLRLTGVTARESWTWVRCMNKYGKKQIDCGGNKIWKM